MAAGYEGKKKLRPYPDRTEGDLPFTAQHPSNKTIRKRKTGNIPLEAAQCGLSSIQIDHFCCLNRTPCVVCV